MWIQSKNEKNQSQIEEKKEGELKGCTFQPTITKEFSSKDSGNRNSNTQNKSPSMSKRSLDKSGCMVPSNDNSYLEIYKKKRGFSLSSGNLKQNSKKK